MEVDVFSNSLIIFLSKSILFSLTKSEIEGLNFVELRPIPKYTFLIPLKFALIS